MSLEKKDKEDDQSDLDLSYCCYDMSFRGFSYNLKELNILNDNVQYPWSYNLEKTYNFETSFLILTYSFDILNPICVICCMYLMSHGNGHPNYLYHV